MAIVTKKETAPEVTEEETAPVAQEPAMSHMTFRQRYGLMCRAIHEEAPKVLKFDSMVDNIDYEYVDTQQYKAFIAMVADRFDLSFMWECSHRTF